MIEAKKGFLSVYKNLYKVGSRPTTLSCGENGMHGQKTELSLPVQYYRESTPRAVHLSIESTNLRHEQNNEANAILILEWLNR